MAQADAGNIVEALENYQKALAISPNYPQIYHNIGNLLQSQNQPTEALTYYLQALEVDPTFTFSYPKALQLAVELNNASASAEILQMAQEYLPDEYLDKLTNIARD